MAQDGKTAADDAARAQAPRLLFASYHCYLDPSSGAAIATRDLLELLASHGWNVRVFCGPTLDFERGESVRQLLSDQGIAFEERTCREGGAPSPPAPLPRPSSMVPGKGSSVASPALPRAGEGSSGMATFSLVEFRQNGVPVTVFVPAGPGRILAIGSSQLAEVKLNAAAAVDGLDQPGLLGQPMHQADPAQAEGPGFFPAWPPCALRMLRVQVIDGVLGIAVGCVRASPKL